MFMMIYLSFPFHTYILPFIITSECHSSLAAKHFRAGMWKRGFKFSNKKFNVDLKIL
jgi:hypothetical protein